MACGRSLALSKIFSSNVTNVFKRQISSSNALRATTIDVSNPAHAERNTESLSDALAAKEKGPWTQLNKEDKIACKFYLTITKFLILRGIYKILANFATDTSLF